ncbi:ParA family protein [Mucilaginibacter sp. X5P1]|uniref:ParA family protein n=1 Tax=Mucilaginibacter sp. X5P1 TaxID=2723088 RepID=UPI00160D6A50|nr:ParA family protein [Mucilaginibacter sp. X5P1]MBB6141684.1 chromosome partitioning protein [Mucilaginibacter sp. X5P1]
MIIIIGNQKGGAGKSTLTLLLANFLTIAKKCKVTVIDMDYQQSIWQKYEKAKLLENTEPYEVIAAGLDQYPTLFEVFNSSPKEVTLIDLPGKLDDDGLIPVFQSADLVVCPFSYDEFTFESTVLFSVVLGKINPKAKVVFIPNRIKANVKYETQSDVDEQLAHFGFVTVPIPDRIDFQRVNTFGTPLAIYPVIIPVFERIYKDHIHKHTHE